MDMAADDFRDLVVESVNARDPDLLSLAVATLPHTLVDRLGLLSERQPRLMLTRGEVNAEPVAAVWLPDRNERYVQVGYLEFDLAGDGARMTAVERPHPDLVAEAPAGFEVAEWESADLADSGEGWWV